MNRAKLVHQKRDKILEIAKNHGATDIRLFGSMARGVKKPNDVDFLIELSNDANLFDVGQMLVELKEELQCEVDLTTTSSIPPDKREKIMSEAKPL